MILNVIQCITEVHLVTVIFNLKERLHIELLCQLHIVFCHIYFLTDAQLCLFGSSCNGFGFRNSDLDITLTFHGRRTDEVENYMLLLDVG